MVKGIVLNQSSGQEIRLVKFMLCLLYNLLLLAPEIKMLSANKICLFQRRKQHLNLCMLAVYFYKSGVKSYRPEG